MSRVKHDDAKHDDAKFIEDVTKLCSQHKSELSEAVLRVVKPGEVKTLDPSQWADKNREKCGIASQMYWECYTSDAKRLGYSSVGIKKFKAALISAGYQFIQNKKTGAKWFPPMDVPSAPQTTNQ